MDVKIRKLEKADLQKGFLESLAPLFRVGLSAEEAGGIFERIKDNPTYRIFVAEIDGEVVGAATLLIEQKFVLKGAKFAYLEDMSVKKSSQGKGVGKLLVQAVIDEANKEECLTFRLDCNDEMIGFYEKNGFKKKDRVHRMQRNLRHVDVG